MQKMLGTTTFKKRGLTGFILPKLIFGSLGLKLNKNYTFEKLHLFILKKKLKFFLKKKIQQKKVWFFLAENYPVFCKGKNARMGKGKGLYQRTIFRTKKNKIFLELFNINFIFLKKISIFFKKYSNLKNSVVTLKNTKLVLFKQNLQFYKLYNRF